MILRGHVKEGGSAALTFEEVEDDSRGGHRLLFLVALSPWAIFIRPLVLSGYFKTK